MKSKVNEEEYIEEYLKDIPDSELGPIFGVSGRTAERISAKLRNQGKVPNRKDLILDLPMERVKQQNRDLGRIDRKTLREFLRAENGLKELDEELIKVITKYQTLPKNIIKTKTTTLKGKAIGIFQISDPHFNELIDLECNKYDFPISSQRCRYYTNEAKDYFKVKKVKKILIAMTGDLLNSDRRLDELLSQATNRSQATFLAVSILEQIILDLAKDFEITVASVIGNESRITKDVGWSSAVASDNYDITIYNILKLIFRKTNIKFVTGNPIEQVIEVNGLNVLLVHGNQIRGKTESKIQSIKGKYAAQGIIIDFVLIGDQHSCRIGDGYARSSSIAGANGYSDSALQLASGASQNIHIIYENGNKDSIKIDLQNVDGVIGYPIEKELEAYNAKSVDKAKKKTIISKIVI